MRFKLFRRRHFGKVFARVAGVVLSCVAVLSVAFFFTSRSIFVRVRDEDDATLLRQIASNIAAIDGAARANLSALFFNEHVSLLKYMRSEDTFTTLVHIARLRRGVMADVNSIEDVVLYNGAQDALVSLFREPFVEDAQLRAVVAETDIAPHAEPWFRIAPSGEGVMTYSLFEGMSRAGGTSTAIFLNIYADALLDCVRELGIDSATGLRQILLLDVRESLIYSGEQAHSDLGMWAAALSQAEGSQEAVYEGERYRVIRQRAGDSGIAVVMVRSVSFIDRPIRALATSTLSIVLLASLFTIIASVGTSRSIYRPLEELLKRLPSDKASAAARDEFAFVRHVIEGLEERVEEGDMHAVAYRDMARERFLFKLLNEPMTGEEIGALAALPEYRLCVDMAQPMQVCMLRVKAGAAGLSRLDAGPELGLALMNVLPGVLGGRCPYEAVITGDRLELLLGKPAQVALADFPAFAASAVQEAAAFIQATFEADVRCGVSETIADASGIFAAAEEAGQNLDYAMLYPDEAVITPEVTRVNRQAASGAIAPEALQALAERLRAGSAQASLEALDDICRAIQQQAWDDALLSIVRLTDRVGAVLRELGVPQKRGAANLKGDLHSLHQALAGDILHALGETGEQALQTTLAQAMEAYIREHHGDPGLALSDVAAHFKLSPRYASHVLKAHTQVSVKAYLNRFRLERAATLLTQTEMTVQNITEHVGMENATYFFSLFKKEYGMTPREYALRMRLQDDASGLAEGDRQGNTKHM